MKTVVFDLDGTMFDTQNVFAQAWDYAGEKMGIGKAGYMITKTLGRSIAASKDIWVSEFGEKYNEQELRRHTKAFLVDYYKTKQAPAKKGLYTLLEYLKSNNYKLAVASSSPRWEVENHLKGAQIFAYFDVIVCGDMVSKSKPEPDIYLSVCDLLGAKPEKCFAIEDSKSGLLSAYRAGCKPIMVPDLWQPDKETKAMLYGKFDDLEEVKNYFAQSYESEKL